MVANFKFLGSNSNNCRSLLLLCVSEPQDWVCTENGREREGREREPYLIEIGAMVVDFIIWGGELGVFVLHLFIDYD